MAKYLDAKNKYEKENLVEAAKIINDGGLVLFPTETVYGLGTDGLNSKAVSKIFKVKGRKTDNPLILHVSNRKMIDEIACNVNGIEEKIIDNFMPGPLTIILNKKDIVPDIITANLDTVGVRMPSSKIAHALIELANTPIAAPSANISGRPSGTNIDDIFEELSDKVDYIIDNGQSDIGIESTVIRVIDDVVHILRPGLITKNDIEKLGIKVVIDAHVLNAIKNNEKVLSPGMKYKHYAPEVKCILVYSDDNKKLINKIKELEQTNPNSLVICRSNNLKYFSNVLAMGNTLEEISKTIFTLLRQVDKYKVDLVIIEGVKSEELGLAIMNRLIKACSYNYIEL